MALPSRPTATDRSRLRWVQGETLNPDSRTSKDMHLDSVSAIDAVPPSLRSARWMTIVAVLRAACAVADRDLPWDRDTMIREAAADLRHFERIVVDASTVEVLAWRTIERSEIRAAPPGLPAVVVRPRSDAALMCARGQLRSGDAGWLLVEAFRHDREEWKRSLIFSEYKIVPPSLRPGETADGTWHGVAEYAHPPTSIEVCQFATVNFLTTRPELQDGPWRLTIRGGLQQQAWRRIARDASACDGWPR